MYQHVQQLLIEIEYFFLSLVQWQELHARKPREGEEDPGNFFPKIYFVLLH
jgi:hypothetical protein